MILGVHLKGSKRVLMGQIYFSEYLRPERSPAARRCACFHNFTPTHPWSALVCILVYTVLKYCQAFLPTYPLVCVLVYYTRY